jgi:hypothetical protein
MLTNDRRLVNSRNLEPAQVEVKLDKEENGRRNAQRRRNKRKMDRKESIEELRALGFSNVSKSIDNVPHAVSPSATWWLVPMPEHLVQSPVPFINKGIGELLRSLSRWCAASPHGRLRGLVLSVVWNELTGHN